MISIVLFGAAGVFLVIFLLSLRKPRKLQETQSSQIKQQPIKQNYGRIQIFFGSQTGTAAKMAEGFAQQATQKGFQPQVIDLKDIKFQHFDYKGEISIFFLSNTGEGQAPDNTVKFMKVLKGKQDLDEIKVLNWSKVSYTVFGLGDTQYQFYNKTGIDADALLQKRGAKRIFRLGLGDNNASMEDDYNEWKDELWHVLIQYRKQNPLQKHEQTETKLDRKISSHQQIPDNRVYITPNKPQLANFKLYICNKQTEKYPYTEEDLDFKTKASLKAQKSIVKKIHQVRQNTNDGSTLQLQIELQNQPVYDTAGNIALYPKNDPRIIQQVIEYFNLTNKELDSYISVQKVDLQRKLKLNFLPYCTLRQLLTSHIDLQGRLTKAILKKLSKFESNNVQYFTTNSSPKTTAEFKRITEQIQQADNWYYLFRLIKQKEVKICLEDFIQLCDSIAPRLFTIGSSYKKQKNVIAMASILEGGLISKYFQRNPQNMKAELRKSTFTDALKWNKVIFIGAGTGFAPFRGFLQEKQILMQRAKNGQDVKYPKITLFFGCKRPIGDFIYKEQIQAWVQNQVIDRFHAAFSRQKQVKVYVQHLLAEQQDQIKQYLQDQNTAIYVCGSLGMGHDVSQVLAQKAGGHDKLKQLEIKGRIIKELW